MALEAELAKDRIEALAPLAVVSGGVVEHDGYVVTDIDCLDDGGCGWLIMRRSSVVVLAGVRGGRRMGGRVSHGGGSIGKGIGEGRIVGH
jgi:hypothetical protein